MFRAFVDKDYQLGDPVTVRPTDEYRRQLQEEMKEMTEPEYDLPFPVSYISPQDLAKEKHEHRETMSSSGAPIITQYFVGKLMKRSTTPLSLLKPSR